MLCSRRLSTLAIAPVLGLASAAGAGELVFNGGFETGNFSGWNVPPNVPPPNPNASNFRVQSGGGGHESMFYAQLSSMQFQFMSQILQTEAGTDYELSFWLRRPSNVLSPFEVRWEGAAVFSELLVLPSAGQWYEFTLPLHANITGSFLEFGQATFPLEWHIDDISVVQVPGPGSAAVFVMAGVCAVRRRRG